MNTSGSRPKNIYLTQRMQPIDPHKLVKQACERSVRKWGLDGMARIRVSGLDQRAVETVTAEAAAWSVIGDTFESGLGGGRPACRNSWA